MMDMIGTCHWRTPTPQPNGFLPLSAKDGLQTIVSMHIHRHFVPHHVRPPPVSLLSHIHTGANASCRACNPSIALSERYGTVPPPCYALSKDPVIPKRVPTSSSSDLARCNRLHGFTDLFTSRISCLNSVYSSSLNILLCVPFMEVQVNDMIAIVARPSQTKMIQGFCPRRAAEVTSWRVASTSPPLCRA
jgi:hypothetical protein